MKQIIHWPLIHGTVNGTGYWPLFGLTSSGSVNETAVGTPWSVTGSFNNLKVSSTVGPGVGRTVTWTLMVNGVATSLSATITHPATSGSDTVNTAAVVPGDVVCLRYTNTGGAPTWANPYGAINVEFDSADDNESGYCQAMGMQVLSADPLYSPVCFMRRDMWSVDNTYLNNELIPLAGSITRLDFSYRALGLGGNFADMAAGDSVAFVLLKNGIVQDGTSGTVDTQTTFAYPATAASWTGSLPVAAGDILKWRATPSAGMVDASGDVYAILTSFRFDSTTAHRFWLGADGWANSAGVLYMSVAGRPNPNATETVYQGFGSVNTWYMIAIQSTGETGTSHFVIDGRLNGTSPAGAPSVGISRSLEFGPLTTIFNSVVVGSAVSPGGSFMTITDPDNWTLRYSPAVLTGTSTVFGINTTIDGATRAFVVGLDGNTNVFTETGKAKVFGNFDVKGYFELQPITAPAAGTTGARIYIDVADGDLKVIFANGQVRTIDVN